MIDVLLLCQTVLTACLGGWIIVGAYDNWRHPALNYEAVAMVTRFDLMAEEYPEDFAHLQHRRIDDPRKIRRLFYLMVSSETLAATALCIGTLCLIAALFGVFAVDTAREIAMIGALLFCCNWVGFLIGGNYFAYWYCHFQAQVTHFLLLLWGVATIILLAQG